MTAEVRIGVDVGGSSTEAVVFAPDGAVLARRVEVTRPTGAGVTATVVAAVRAALAAAHGTGAGDGDGVAGRGAVGPRARSTADEGAGGGAGAGGLGAGGNGGGGIGVGVPGQVDPVAGTVALAVNLGIDGTPYPLAAELAAAFARPVVLENDVRAAALGASLALGVDTSLALLAVGTGISAGLVVNGRIRRGRDGMAGEIGHAPVAAGPTCACGLDGCLEALAAGPAIARAWPQGGDRPADALFSAALDGDPDACRAAAPIVRHLTTGITWLLLTWAPDVLVLGGGAGSTPALLPLLRDELRRRAARSDLARRVLDPERLVSLPPRLAAGALGAAALATQRPNPTKEGS